MLNAPVPAARKVLAKAGLKPSDVSVIGVGAGNGAVAAMRAGQIDAISNLDPVITLLQTAAADPTVVAIKMTVYRTGTDSVLMETLIQAAQAGKEVTVVVEPHHHGPRRVGRLLG